MLILDMLNHAYNSDKKLLFVLIDPDYFEENRFKKLIASVSEQSIDAFLVGGSLITGGNISETIGLMKKNSHIPVCIFPGNYRQIDQQADAILFMSLISGRNPDFLIGNQVVAAPMLKNSNLEIIPTGYMLVDGGKLTAAHYMSNTLPIPNDKPEIAACTALAGQMLGLKCMYLDAGSGAEQSLLPDFIRKVCSEISIPLIAGGGIRNAETASGLLGAGATAVVIGNAAESNPEIISEISTIIK